MSDWLATHSTSKSVNAGLDMTMPGGITFETVESYFGSRLYAAIERTEVPKERLRDMALRIVAAWYKVKAFISFPQENNMRSSSIFAWLILFSLVKMR